MPGSNPGVHLAGFWKYVGTVTLASGVVTLGAVLGARLPNRHVCVVVNVPGDTATYAQLFDTTRGLALPDTRGGPPVYDSRSPDSRYDVQLQPDGAGTYTLLVREVNGEHVTVLQEGAALTMSDTALYMVSWSPDSRRVAYVWSTEDGQAYLSIANYDSSEKRSALFTRWDGGEVTSTNSIVAGWSADQRYVLIRERRGSLERSYSIWSAVDLRPVPTRFDGQLDKAVWSPQGHWLVATRENEDGAQQLVILSPGGAENEVVERLLPNRVQVLAWSPNGQYVAAISQAQVCHVNRCAMRWQYDIFRADGTQAQDRIIGSQLLPNDGTVVLGEPEVIPAAWSPEGERWLYLSERRDREALVTDLMSVNVASGREETLGAHVMTRSIPGIFYGPWQQGYQASIADDHIVFPSGNYLMLPTRTDDDKLRVELVDLENERRFTLVEGADQGIPGLFGWLSNRMRFWTEAEWLMVPWMRYQGGEAEAHITVARRDGSYRFETPNAVEAISQIQWINEEWLGFLGQREGGLGLEVVNVLTGEQRQLVAALEEQPYWGASAAPQGRLVALTIYGGGFDPLGKGSLYLLSLDDLSLKAVSFEVAQPSYPIWSPDGSMLAFVKDSAQGDATVQVVTAEGEPVQEAPIGSMTAWGAWVSGFTRCE